MATFPCLIAPSKWPLARIIDVPFKRPRKEEIRGSAEMGTLKQEIWNELKAGATVEG